MNLKKLNEKEKQYLTMIIISIVALVVELLLLADIIIEDYNDFHKPAGTRSTSKIGAVNNSFEMYSKGQNGLEIEKLLNILISSVNLQELDGYFKIPKLTFEIEEENVITVECKETKPYRYSQNEREEFLNQINEILQKAKDNQNFHRHLYYVEFEYDPETGLICEINIMYNQNNN